MPRNNSILPSPSTAPRETHLQRFRRDLVSVPYSEVAKAVAGSLLTLAAVSNSVTTYDQLTKNPHILELARKLGVSTRNLPISTFCSQLARELRNNGVKLGLGIAVASVLSDTLKVFLSNPNVRDRVSRSINALNGTIARARARRGNRRTQ